MSLRKASRLAFAAISYTAAVVATVFIIDAVRTVPVDRNELGLWVVVAVVGIGVGSLLIRRPRV